jgi:hypothetical protein
MHNMKVFRSSVICSSSSTTTTSSLRVIFAVLFVKLPDNAIFYHLFCGIAMVFAVLSTRALLPYYYAGGQPFMIQPSAGFFPLHKLPP